MTNDPQESISNEESFSWEKWFRMGLRAFKKTLTRYNFGMPDEFWQHLENAFEELLAAMRIAMHAILDRRRSAGSPSSSPGKSIDIEWDDWDEDDWAGWD